MAQKITDKLVRSLKPPAKGYTLLFDSEQRGFGVRITKNGVIAFILNYRAGGRERRLTIGNYPDWSVAAAREGGRLPLGRRSSKL